MNRFHKELWLFSTIVLFFSTKLNSQGFSTKDPIEYNDYIILQQNNLGAAINEYSVLIDQTQFVEEKLNASYNKMVQVASQCLSNIKKMEAFDGATGFRDAAYNLFFFYQNVIDHQFKERMTLRMKPEFGDADVKRLNEIITGIGEEERAIDEKFTLAQGEFAKKHGFSLEN